MAEFQSDRAVRIDVSKTFGNLLVGGMRGRVFDAGQECARYNVHAGLGQSVMVNFGDIGSTRYPRIRMCCMIAPVGTVGTMKRVLWDMDILENGFTRFGSLQLCCEFIIVIA
uniref:Uncharacterized protein n=1 Tax=Cacopsylla melanoneura TaxID=428564 RepID=A0A8D9ENP8_9HEMI